MPTPIQAITLNTQKYEGKPKPIEVRVARWSTIYRDWNGDKFPNYQARTYRHPSPTSVSRVYAAMLQMSTTIARMK